MRTPPSLLLVPLILACSFAAGCNSKARTQEPSHPPCFPSGEITRSVQLEAARKDPAGDLELRLRWNPGTAVAGAPLPSTTRAAIPHGLECKKPFTGALDATGVSVSGGDRSVELSLSADWLNRTFAGCTSRTLLIPIDLTSSEYDLPCDATVGKQGRPTLTMVVELGEALTSAELESLSAGRWELR